MNHPALRRELAATLRNMAASSLSPGASGNISIRSDNGMLISPSGLKAEQASAEQMVEVCDDGSQATGQAKPSSEWLMHQRIYHDHPQAQAIVHCHSRYATVLACQRKSIPAFHYMVAVAGGVDIPCASYATFGSAELAENVSLALHRRKACLMANHGQICWGESADMALSLAKEVEALSANYYFSLQGSGPALLSDEEMEQVVQQFRHYGQR